PSAAFPADVVYYPASLMAPDSEAQADILPIGCGPFKFVRWERNQVTEMVRFEHYFETDAEGHSLPYLDGLIGLSKKEDHVRLAALRGGEVHLIDSMAYADAAAFPRRFAGQYQTWEVPTLGTAFIMFNLEKGPFQDKTLRQAAAHAIDHEAIHQAVFAGQGDIATGFYARVSPWYAAGARPWPEYDPDKARFLLRQARAVGTEVLLQAENAWPYMQQTGELVQAMWAEVGFKTIFNIYDRPVLLQKRRAGDFHADSAAAGYRFDPDGWFSRSILSTAPTTREASRFSHAQADTLILEARATADKQRRLEIYAEIDSIINEELPVLYTHHLTLLAAGVMRLRGYQPAISGPFTTRGGGIRTAWLA
ncbi:MAG TPA: ABC transporter substrate-binding protein, partial [Candidatus Tectomicrobia bacterium]